MKQRVRIRRVKEKTYKYYIYMWALKRKWKSVLAEMRKLSDELRRVYEEAREKNEMSAVRDLGHQAGDAPQQDRQHNAT